jgi:hypothetical protein
MPPKTASAIKQELVRREFMAKRGTNLPLSDLAVRMQDRHNKQQARLVVKRNAARAERFRTGTETSADKAYAEGRSGAHRRRTNKVQPPTAAELQTRKEEKNRRTYLVNSASTLADYLVHKTGCSVEGCMHSDAKPLFTLLMELDHFDETTKSGTVSALRNERRVEELVKVASKCLLCHSFHTYDQRNKNGIERPCHSITEKTMRATKLAAGCQHPCHAKMPYAKQIDAFLSLESFPKGLRAGALQVSHLVRRNDNSSGLPHMSVVLQDLVDGKARVCCIYCHELETMLEEVAIQRARWSAIPELELSALSRHHLNQLEAHPQGAAFILDFDTKTAGIDWFRLRQEVSDRKRKSMQATWDARKRIKNE